MTFEPLEPGRKSKFKFAADKWVVLKLLQPTQITQTKNICFLEKCYHHLCSLIHASRQIQKRKIC